MTTKIKPSRSARALRDKLSDGSTTIKEMAKKLSCSTSYISNLLSGDRLPGRKLAVSIQKLTGIRVSGWGEQ